VNGCDVAAQAGEVRESISLTGHFAAVDEILTGRENLVRVAKLRHLVDPGTVADDLLRRLSLTEAGGRRASTYSGGIRRRLDIAMSLIGDLPVIFLDEPTTGVRAPGQQRPSSLGVCRRRGHVPHGAGESCMELRRTRAIIRGPGAAGVANVHRVQAPTLIDP
jgi:ABC-type transport system involved in cytochrome c biogenesis ATPase subunit